MIDVVFACGPVHAIDKVLLPANKNLVETAQSLPQFSVLVEAVVAATLQGESFSVDATLTITDQRARKSNITATDVLTSNGVSHVIDKEILPRP